MKEIWIAVYIPDTGTSDPARIFGVFNSWVKALKSVNKSGMVDFGNISLYDRIISFGDPDQPFAQIFPMTIDEETDILL